MKKIYLLLLLATFSLNLFCQQDHELVLDSTISYEWDDDFNEWRKSEKYVYAYDSTGNQTEEINYEWNDDFNKWRKSEKICLCI